MRIASAATPKAMRQRHTDSGAKAKPTMPAVPTKMPRMLREKFQAIDRPGVVHQHARLGDEQEWDEERAPADHHGRPAGGPAGHPRDIGGGVGRNRHRRRDHRLSMPKYITYMCAAIGETPSLIDRRRQQRRGEHIDAHRRHAHAENDADDRGQEQQHEEIAAR